MQIDLLLIMSSSMFGKRHSISVFFNSFISVLSFGLVVQHSSSSLVSVSLSSSLIISLDLYSTFFSFNPTTLRTFFSFFSFFSTTFFLRGCRFFSPPSWSQLSLVVQDRQTILRSWCWGVPPSCICQPYKRLHRNQQS